MAAQDGSNAEETVESLSISRDYSFTSDPLPEDEAARGGAIIDSPRPQGITRHTQAHQVSSNSSELNRTAFLLFVADELNHARNMQNNAGLILNEQGIGDEFGTEVRWLHLAPERRSHFLRLAVEYLREHSRQ
jgi:hypothetical protein